MTLPIGDVIKNTASRLEIASTPVMAVQPFAKARNNNQKPAPTLASGTAGATSKVVNEMAAFQQAYTLNP